MLIHIIAQDEQDQIRDFTLYLDSFESSLDMISTMAALNEQILKAEIIDPDLRRMHLPVEAFDGTLLSPAIRQLTTEWQQLLNQPVPPARINHYMLCNQTRRQLINNELLITRLVNAIELSEAKLLLIRDKHFNKLIGARLIQHQERLLSTLRKQQKIASLRHEALTHRLQKLADNLS